MMWSQYVGRVNSPGRTVIEHGRKRTALGDRPCEVRVTRLSTSTQRALDHTVDQEAGLLGSFDRERAEERAHFFEHAIEALLIALLEDLAQLIGSFAERVGHDARAWV